MLKNIVESKLFTGLNLIIDGERIGGGDLFRAFLINSTRDKTTQEKVHLICLENPPKSYEICHQGNENVIQHDYFSDSCRWNGGIEPDLKTFLSEFKKESCKDRLLCFDSLDELVVRLGLSTTYKLLHEMKSFCKKIVCLSHENLFKPEDLEKFIYLATTIIHLNNQLDPVDYSLKKGEKLARIIHRKPGGKISSQAEIFTIDGDFQVSSLVNTTKNKLQNSAGNVKKKFNDLTTFELGLEMKEEERRAKEQLVLPYLRTEPSDRGEIIYNLENIDLEDDPDDDLDI